MCNFRENVNKMHSLGGRCFGKQVYPQTTGLFFLMTAIASVNGLAYKKFKYLYLVPKGFMCVCGCVCVCVFLGGGGCGVEVLK